MESADDVISGQDVKAVMSCRRINSEDANSGNTGYLHQIVFIKQIICMSRHDNDRYR